MSDDHLSNMEIYRILQKYGHEPDVTIPDIQEGNGLRVKFSCRLCKHVFLRPIFRNPDGTMPEFTTNPCPRNLPNWAKAQCAAKKGALI